MRYNILGPARGNWNFLLSSLETTSCAFGKKKFC
jgi:hypothetical protein